MDGPVGTGKTRAILEKVNLFCEAFPRIRVVLFRQTRASLTESVMVTLEEKVLGYGHPAIHGQARRANRHSYVYPNGSEIVVGGLDRPDKIMSTEWDIACCFEAIEIPEDAWNKITTRLRNGAIMINGRTFHQAICDTNPGDEFHWLNKRPDRVYERGMLTGDPLMRRILSRHVDNPALTDEYLAGLERHEGIARERLVLGRWTRAEGIIYEDWDMKTHTLSEYDDYGRPNLPPFKWYFGAMDFGLRDPGTLQVWAVDGDHRIYLVDEIYRTDETPIWWARQVNEVYQKYPMRAIACDPSQPQTIRIINGELVRNGGRAIAMKAENAIQAGINIVKQKLRKEKDGKPSIFVVLGCNSRVGHDPRRERIYKPTCLTQEISSYCYKKMEEGKIVKDAPDPMCEDHAMDTLRYAAMFVWNFLPKLDRKGMTLEQYLRDYADKADRQGEIVV